MIEPMRELARDILSEDEAKDSVIAVLAEFFHDSFKDDPVGVGDW